MKGKVALLHFGHMHREPELEHIDELYTKHHENGFEAIGFSLGGWHDGEALRDFIRREDHQGRYIYVDRDGDHAAVCEVFGFGQGSAIRKVKLPAFILIDTNGKVIDARTGKVHSPEVWATRLEKLITDNL